MMTVPSIPAGATTGYVTFRDYRTWYRKTQPPRPTAGRLPLVILHGGPGVPHNYCLPMANLGDDGRIVVQYDQIGCGESSHDREADSSQWQIQLFVAELANLVRELRMEGGFHLLGHSWGGMLALEFALAHSDGIASLTICNSPASMPLWREAADRLRSGLPRPIQETMRRHESAGSTDADEYLAAVELFYARHVCRLQPAPSYLKASFEKLAEDPTVYATMNGPNEFHVVGTLRDWSIVDRLPQIGIPTLVIAGEHDEAAPETWQPFVDFLPDVRVRVFAGSSHMPHIEAHTEFMDAVGEFLRAHDRVLPDRARPSGR